MIGSWRGEENNSGWEVGKIPFPWAFDSWVYKRTKEID